LDAVTLHSLLTAYSDADALARRALVDFLDDAGDPRADTVHEELIDWEAYAALLCRLLVRHDVAYVRHLIDCARFGAATLPAITQAVRAERLRWLAELFPEAGLEAPPRPYVAPLPQRRQRRARRRQ